MSRTRSLFIRFVSASVLSLAPALAPAQTVPPGWQAGPALPDGRLVFTGAAVLQHASPASATLRCHLSTHDWFEEQAPFAFTIEIKAGERYVMKGGGEAGQGRFRTEPLTGDVARLLSQRLAHGGAIQFIDPASGKAGLVGAYGQLQMRFAGAGAASPPAAPWIYMLQTVTGKQAKLRCAEPGALAAWKRADLNAFAKRSEDPPREQAGGDAASSEKKRAEQALRDKQEAAKLAKRNLAPPPPGATRVEGLFAYADHKNESYWDIGPLGGAGMLKSRVWTEWRFLYFQKNGYVYTELPEAQTRCDRPAVNEDGTPLCTTYRIDGQVLRVGLDAEGTVDEAGIKEGFMFEGHYYSSLEPPDPQQLAGAYEEAECFGAMCSRSGWVFGSDGRFGRWGLSQAFGTGAGVAGQPIARTYTGTAHRKGRYRINGYRVDLQFDDGEKLTVPVILYPGGKTLRVGGSEFVRQ
ncbi:hypothetical protein BURC_01002 [Burkholderiaceae bacterium]|nr:hypothetical protein BURC_01002 [Burkholderiaceae bacterium]